MPTHTRDASADKWPPGPGGTCLDTLTISQIQDTLSAAPCHPAVGDTVLGIAGTVTGFDTKPAAYAVFFQNSQGGPYSGIQVFTGAFNYNAAPFNLALGDSIVVYGRIQEAPASNGTTEIDGPDVIQSTNDIVIRKISSGNPLPPFQILTPSQMNQLPPVSQGEWWEGCLVRLRGPLRVARTSTTGGLPTNSFLVVSVASPFDSTLIDGNSLTTYAPPAVSTALDSVQGIVSQATTSGINTYRVQLRSSDDAFTVGPPKMTDAYPIEDNIIRVVFDRNLDVSTAEDEAHYELASGLSGSTVNVATVEGGAGKVVRLNITSVLVDGDVETLNASGIGSENCPPCLSSAQSRFFINGVLDIATIQTPDQDSLSSCVDRSRFAGPQSSPGTRLSLRGVGVGQFGSLQFLEDQPGGNRSGLSVFGPIAPLTPGHRFLISGQVQEFGGETELVNNVYLVDEGAVTAPSPMDDQDITVLTDATCDAGQNVDTGEDAEGVLVKVYDLRVAERRTVGQSWLSAGPCCTYPDTILVSNLNFVLNAYTPPDSGSIIDVTGILHFANGTFRICPRNAGDIVVHLPTSVAGGVIDKVSFSLVPNPARSALLTFTLPRRDDVELGVFDLLGRRVAVLARGNMIAGAYSREWNGRDASGRNLGAGVYFFRLKVGGETYMLRGVTLN